MANFYRDTKKKQLGLNGGHDKKRFSNGPIHSPTRCSSNSSCQQAPKALPSLQHEARLSGESDPTKGTLFSEFWSYQFKTIHCLDCGVNHGFYHFEPSRSISEMCVVVLFEAPKHHELSSGKIGAFRTETPGLVSEEGGNVEVNFLPHLSLNGGHHGEVEPAESRRENSWDDVWLSLARNPNIFKPSWLCNYISICNSWKKYKLRWYPQQRQHVIFETWSTATEHNEQLSTMRIFLLEPLGGNMGVPLCLKLHNYFWSVLPS